MEIELIFGVIQSVVTAILGSFTKRGKVPKRFIPLQNAIVGMIAVSMGVGGVYDATQTKIKEK